MSARLRGMPRSVRHLLAPITDARLRAGRDGRRLRAGRWRVLGFRRSLDEWHRPGLSRRRATHRAGVGHGSASVRAGALDDHAERLARPTLARRGRGPRHPGTRDRRRRGRVAGRVRPGRRGDGLRRSSSRKPAIGVRQHRVAEQRYEPLRHGPAGEPRSRLTAHQRRHAAWLHQLGRHRLLAPAPDQPRRGAQQLRSPRRGDARPEARRTHSRHQRPPAQRDRRPTAVPRHAHDAAPRPAISSIQRLRSRCSRSSTVSRAQPSRSATVAISAYISRGDGPLIFPASRPGSRRGRPRSPACSPGRPRSRRTRQRCSTARTTAADGRSRPRTGPR